MSFSSETESYSQKIRNPTSYKLGHCMSMKIMTQNTTLQSDITSNITSYRKANCDRVTEFRIGITKNSD